MKLKLSDFSGFHQRVALQEVEEVEDAFGVPNYQGHDPPQG